MDNPNIKTLSFQFTRQVGKPVDVYIGIQSLNNLSHYLTDLRPQKIFYIVDELFALKNAQHIQVLLGSKNDVHLITVSADETQKNLKTVELIADGFFKNGGSPASIICSVGGGVVGNIAGFFASITYRGLIFAHVPTTLLSQLDSAVDVKQSVNSGGVKNSLGTLDSPRFVVIDPALTNTLSQRDFRSGLAEAAKHGFAQDKKLIELIQKVDRNDLSSVQTIIEQTLALKFKHWQAHPGLWSETSEARHLTHLGHTTGKILESHSYGYFTHGEAIAHGMVVEARISQLLGHLDQPQVDFIETTLRDLKLLKPFSKDYLAKNITQQIYNRSNPHYALLRGIGETNIVSEIVPAAVFTQALHTHLAIYAK